MKRQNTMYDFLARCTEFWHEWFWLIIGSVLMMIFWGMILKDVIKFYNQ